VFDIGGLNDLVIALAALVVAVVLFLLWRMGILTKKTLPLVAGALAALVGLGAWRASKRSKLRKEIERKEEELREREKKLEEAKARAEISETQLEAGKKQLEQEREAHAKEMLRIDAETEEAKQRIDELSTEEVFDEFRRTFGSQGGGR